MRQLRSASYLPACLAESQPTAAQCVEDTRNVVGIDACSQLLDKIDIREVPVKSARVTVSDTARDLGVIIDSRLTMADHVAAVCRSCYYQLRQLRSVAFSRSS